LRAVIEGEVGPVRGVVSGGEGGAEGGGDIAALDFMAGQIAELEGVDVVVDPAAAKGVGVEPNGEEKAAAGGGFDDPRVFEELEDVGIEPAADACIDGLSFERAAEADDGAGEGGEVGAHGVESSGE
jgi:hypothetical protein